MLFTTSWDDGSILDKRIARLLVSFDMTGTFYVLPEQERAQEKLTFEDLKSLNAQHEVGAHTLTHTRLTTLSSAQAQEEIKGSKKWVEDVTQKECKLFCYPYGEQNEHIRTLVREAGFLGARTVESLEFTASDPFTLPTSLQVTPFPWRRSRGLMWRMIDPLGPVRSHWKKIQKLSVPLSALKSWQQFARALFMHALKNNKPFFHLWGHSEEIEKYGLWEDFQAFLSFIAEHKKDVRSVPNSALLPIPSHSSKPQLSHAT